MLLGRSSRTLGTASSDHIARIDLRQPLLGPNARAHEYRLELGIVRGQLRPVGGGMPQMDDPGGETAVLAPHAGAQQPDQEIGVLTAPAVEVRVEAVNRIEVAAPDREIARAGALPFVRFTLAQRTERQVEQRGQPVDAAIAPPAPSSP